MKRERKKCLCSIACFNISCIGVIGCLLLIGAFPVSAADPYETWLLMGYAVGKTNGTEIAGVSMAEVIRLDDGTYRMYYGTVLGGGLNGIKYAESADCETWTVKGTALEGTSGETSAEYMINGASILRLPDGRYRMYYQSAPFAGSGAPKLHVRSAISSDGKTFEKEGVRINIDYYDSSSTLSLAGHGSYYYAADGTTVVGIFCANYASKPIAPSDLVMATSTDDGLTFKPSTYTKLYELWHDPIVLKVNGQYRLYATNLVGDPAPYQGIAISSDGLTWPSSMTEVSFVDMENNALTEADSGVGDIGGVVLSSGSIRLFTNYGSSSSGSDIVVFAKLSACSECSGSPVTLTGITFESGRVCKCSDATAINLGSGVTVKSGATVFFEAPAVNIGSGTRFEQGSHVIIK